MSQLTTGNKDTTSVPTAGGTGVRALGISTAANRYSKDWKNKTVSWEDLLTRLATPTVTQETHAEFMHLPRGRQADIKDIGGFVGGSLKGGRRKIEYVQCRSMITLDADNDPTALLTDLDITADYTWAVYSTHKHAAAHPRLRLIIPLDRDVSVEEHEAIARMVASDYGIDIFDHTCFRATQLMYWPSVSADGEYVFEKGDGPFLSADMVLGRYTDWHDISFWPRSDTEQKAARGEGVGRHQKDPLTKPGIVGAFCRTYSIPEAIDAFLGDVYAPTGCDDRYTYKSGTTSGGLVVYDDRFAFSHHSTDPASGLLCNAFDLVRIHKFGDLDEDAAPTKTGTALPSYKAMSDFATNDPETKKLLIEERRASISSTDYDDEDGGGEEGDWETQLDIDKQGRIKNTIPNLLLIFTHDPALRGLVFNELADGTELKGDDIPWRHPAKFWRDADDAQLECYLATAYAPFTKTLIETVVTKVADDRAYHPIKDYFSTLPPWDGIPRVETLLVDYLGAEDSEYTRAVTRKTLCAAIQRVYHPGIKFDYILTIIGPQGIKKSTLVGALGMEWYSDSLSMDDTHDKTAAEKLQGMWIMEIGEMAGMKKTDIEKLKAFITRQDDKYRASYGHRVTPHPRQCIFIGTTNNEDGFLRDITGNRRFWPVNVAKHVKDITQDDIDQIWAEALTYAEDEALYLTFEQEEEAERQQREAVEHDPREGKVRDYLDTLLPDNWSSLSVWERRDWLEDPSVQKRNPGVAVRTEVCLQEIWSEAFGMEVSRMARKDSYELKAIMQRIDGWDSAGRKTKRFRLYGPQAYYVRKAASSSDPDEA